MIFGAFFMKAYAQDDSGGGNGSSHWWWNEPKSNSFCVASIAAGYDYYDSEHHSVDKLDITSNILFMFGPGQDTRLGFGMGGLVINKARYWDGDTVVSVPVTDLMMVLNVQNHGSPVLSGTGFIVSFGTPWSLRDQYVYHGYVGMRFNFNFISAYFHQNQVFMWGIFLEGGGSSIAGSEKQLYTGNFKVGIQIQVPQKE